MAYSVPELLLVGATQNLVLGPSEFGNETVECPQHNELDDKHNEIYDSIGLW